MRPIEFEEQNNVLTKPEGMTDEECTSLPCFCDGKQVISRWGMSWRERLVTLLTGKVWVSVWTGSSVPPILVTTEYPFLKVAAEHEKTA